MNFKQKSAAVLLSLGCLVASPSWAKLNVFACEPEWKSLAETLGDEHIKAISATTAFQDPHHVEARPSLIVKARQADIIFCTGAELEIGWLPLLLSKSGNRQIQVNQVGHFLAASFVDRIEIPTSVDRSHGDVHASGNPHVHWGPYRLLDIAHAFSLRLQSIDPDNSPAYQQNYSHFAEQWKAAIQDWENISASLKNKKAIVYHKNWSYLLNWLDLEVIGDLEPKPGIPPSSSHLARLLSEIVENKPDFILIANYQDDKGARWLSQKSGVPIIRLPFTVGGNKEAADLPSLYDNVIKALIKHNG